MIYWSFLSQILPFSLGFVVNFLQFSSVKLGPILFNGSTGPLTLVQGVCFYCQFSRVFFSKTLPCGSFWLLSHTVQRWPTHVDTIFQECSGNIGKQHLNQVSRFSLQTQWVMSSFNSHRVQLHYSPNPLLRISKQKFLFKCSIDIRCWVSSPSKWF